MLVDIHDDGSIIGTLLGSESVRVGFQSPIASARSNFKFVHRAFIKAGDEEFPDSRLAAQAHRMNAAIPEIKISHNADAQRIRRPHSEVDATNAGHFTYVCTKLFVFLIV